jgi:uncharacterized protein YfaS (alpha-2-macroglobulin family)
MRYVLALAALCAAVVAISSCTPSAPAPAKLAAVSPMAKPALPPWIASISPLGKAESLAQIRVIFAKPVTSLQSLSGEGPRAVLDHVSIEPALRGHFVVLTPRMIGFVADQAIPVGTRVRVTLSAGLRDLAGDALTKDLAWTFETDDLAFSGLPSVSPSPDETAPPPVGLRPTIKITANAAVDVSSLAAHATLAANGENVPLDVTLEAQPTPYPGSNAAELFDPSLKDWIYDLKPQRDLKTATTYTLKIASGVDPAYGNVPTSDDFTGAVHTFDPLAIVPTPKPSPDTSPSGRFANGDPAIVFNNPLDTKSIEGAVTISPAPSASVKQLTQLSDDGTTVSIDPYALDPDKTYIATFAATIKDVFGQTLAQDQHVTITTADFAPGVFVPTGNNLIPAGVPVGLNFYATNLPGNSYQFASARVPTSKLLGTFDALKQLPADYTSWPKHALPGARRNVQSVVQLPLQQLIGGKFGTVAYGFYTQLDNPNSAPSWVGTAELTNLGVFAQWFPSNGIVLVQHLSDGAPAPNVSITAYRMSSDSSVIGDCAHGTTNAQGELDITGVDLERCYAGAREGQAPSVGIVATEGADVETLMTSSYSGIYRYDVNGGWTSGAPLARGTVFTDRQMYQPGERGEITGVAYYVNGNKVVADRNATYQVTLEDPSNNSKSLGSVKTDSYGVFSLPITFSKQQALGYYTLDAKGANGNDINGSLRVAEFKPPNFKLDLSLSATSATAGSSLTASATASYLFGAPLQGGTAHAYVTRDVAYVTPKGWDDYWFGRQWFYPELTPSFDSDVLQKDLPLDAQGKTTLDVAVPADLPFPMEYRVDMETTDVSNLSVSDSKSFTALPADAVIGLTSDVAGTAGQPMPIRSIVTDNDGKVISGRSVHYVLQKMTYTSASQAQEGGESAQQSIKYDDVATADATSGDQPVTVNLTPPDTGPYRVRANFSGASSDASATDIALFAFGAGEADWGLTDPNAVAVKLDKKKYAIGDTATASIAAPFPQADVYVSVVRGTTLYRTALHNVSGAQRVSFKITQDMLPNAAFEAVVVRRGPSLASIKPGSLDTLSRVGMAAFDVDVADRYLKLGIAPQNATVHPGGSQSVDFTLTNKDGSAAQGEVIAMVVNDAILQLTGYRPPDLVDTVFAAQPISTIFADSREGVVLKTPTAPSEKGFGYGGGFLAGAGSTRVRQHFLPLAYYGVVKTDASGKAHVSMTMPDDLTTWRVMAVAIGNDDAHFVTDDATFISNLPLSTNPLLPQFARPGDKFDLGVSALNQTGAAGALDLVLKLTGALAFAQGDPQSQRASENADNGSVQAWRFPVMVGTPAPTTFEATSTLGSASDAFEVPFEVRARGITDSVIEAGATANGAASVPIALDRGGWLQITLANSIVPQFVTPSSEMMNEDPLPFADEAASRLTIASALQKLRDPYRLKLSFDPAAQAATSLQQLYSLQRGDGGFREFASEKESEPFTSAFAVDALVFARAHGVTVDGSVVSRATQYVAQNLANPGRNQWCNDEPCKSELRFESLWALAQAGDRRTDFLSDIVANEDLFCSATRIRLARYLLQTPGWQGQGATLADKLQQTLYITGRYATANVATRWGWLGSLVNAQAEMLQLLVERHAAVEQQDGAVRALVAQQCKCGWPTMDDTASALTALSAYAATEHLGPATATATVGSATVATAQFGSTASSQTFTVQASSLHGNAVALRGNGTVHYALLYTYDVPPNSPGELAAFRVVRTVAEPGATSPPLATMDLETPAGPVNVTAGHVFDVGVRVIVDHPVDRLVIDDSLPAGFEAVDTSFRTTLQAVVPQSDSWDIDSQTIYRDRVVAYAQHLGPGVYDVHYLVRSVTPGDFSWPGARAYMKDAPEEFGRSASTTLHVTP